MAKMYIIPGGQITESIIGDISGYDYRVETMPVVTFNGPAYTDFPGADVYASDFITEEDGTATIIVATKAGQTTAAMTDYIEISCGEGIGVSFAVYKDSQAVDNLSSIYTAPWTFFRTSSGIYGIVAWNERDSEWGGFQFALDRNTSTYVTAVYDLTEVDTAADVGIHKNSMLLGWLMGRQNALRRTKVTPLVTYLYNGVELPALSEWDRTTYPYALIEHEENGGNSSLYVSSVPMGIVKKKLWGDMLCAEGQVSFAYKDGYMRFSGDFVTDFEFEFETDDATTIITAGRKSILWANYDVMDWDTGTVLVAASEPVPVYE